MPIHATFYYLRAHANVTLPPAIQQQIAPDLGPVDWDIDKVMLCVREGDKREEFVRALEVEMEAFVNSSELLLNEPTPDAYMTALDAIIINCAMKFFGKSAKPADDLLGKLAAERLNLLRKRRELKIGLVNASSDPEFARVSADLAVLTKQVRAIRRKRADRLRSMQLDELWEHWRARRIAECFRLFKTLGAARRGPKCRSFSTLRSALPSKAAWLAAWGLSGPLGGMNAYETSWPQMLETHLEVASERPPPPRDLNHFALGKRDVLRLRRHCMFASKRKSAPEQSVPAGILLVALAPQWQLKGNRASKLLGVGAQPLEICAPWTFKAMVDGYAQVNRTGLSVLKWHVSWGLASQRPTTWLAFLAFVWFTGWTSKARPSTLAKWRPRISSFDLSILTAVRASFVIVGRRLER